MLVMRHGIKLLAMFIIVGCFFGGYILYRSLSRNVTSVSCPMWHNPNPSYVRVELKNNKYQDANVIIKSKERVSLIRDEDQFFRSINPMPKGPFEIFVSSGGEEVFLGRSETSCEFSMIEVDVPMKNIEVSCYPCSTGV